MIFAQTIAIWIFALFTVGTSQDIVHFETDNQCSATSENRVCVEINKCPSANRIIRNGEKPESCGFKGMMPLVCCSHANALKTDINLKSISPQVESPHINFECGERGLQRIFIPDHSRFRRTPKREVAGGEIAIKNSWPWMALLGRKRGPNNNFFCSASLINENYAITAAHCLKDFEPFFIRLGEHDYAPGTPDNSEPEDVNVTDILPYPEYKLQRGYYDIALLKLARPIEFRNDIRPICLPWGKLAKEDIVGKSVTITGWGTTEYAGSSSSVLREVNVTAFHPSTCVKSYSTLRDFPDLFPEGMNINNIVCSGVPEGGKAACQGDSGGPVIRYKKESKIYILTAIISKGFGCGKEDFPGLNSPIGTQPVLEWIKKIAFQ